MLAHADSNADINGHVLHALQLRLRRGGSVVFVVAQLIGDRPALRVAVPFHGDNFPSTKDDVQHERSQYANARNDDSDAVVYRLDKFTIPCGLGALLGDDERRANYSAVVDEHSRRQKVAVSF